MALTKTTKAIGQHAETIANNYLRQRGLRFVGSNIAFRQGEIDLIMQDGNYLVFIEVRYRRNTAFGSALETITSVKQKRLMLAAMNYLMHNPRWQNKPIRFDVVAVEGDNITIQWIKNAFLTDERDD
ncbi:MAG: YraN family protein [Gammaproteobacteria bacterium]|jgi:putative endonuclease|nr:YraN family protein [Gammaproteobacteria bacterium]